MIPKRIHQTWKSKTSNPSIDVLRNTWIEQHPGFTYHYYDDTDIADFICRYFDERVQSVFKRIKNGSLKADFFRYCVLYVHGGVYVDVDISCIVPLTDVLCFDTDELVSASDFQERDHQPPNNDYRLDTMYQAFLCAKPFHPFLRYMINYMCFVISSNLFKHDVFRIGGPEAFSNCFDEYRKERTSITDRPCFKKICYREANNPLFKNEIKIVSHLHECEYLGYNRVVFARCQHPLDRGDNPHYHNDREVYRDTGLYD